MNQIGIILFAILLCLCLTASTPVSATQEQAYRPAAASTITFLDDSGFYGFIQKMMMPGAGMPDFEGALKAAVKPITDQIGAFFYVILFGVPYLVLWIRQRSLLSRPSSVSSSERGCL